MSLKQFDIKVAFQRAVCFDMSLHSFKVLCTDPGMLRSLDDSNCYGKVPTTGEKYARGMVDGWYEVGCRCRKNPRP